MKIEHASYLSFGAKLIKQCDIAKRNDSLDLAFEKTKASVVEIQPENFNEISAVIKAAGNWGEKDVYGKAIGQTAKALQSKFLNSKKTKIYAFTLQNDNLAHINWKDIIGLSQLTLKGKNKFKMDFIQIKPDLTGKSSNKKYSPVGKRFIKSLMSLQKVHEIYGNADYRSANFFEKMGFEMADCDTFLYIWKKFKK